MNGHQTFQSTPPRGGRPRRRPSGSGAQVSIHAPAGGRPRCRDMSLMPRRFQSTPPRGGRHGSSSGSASTSFNPRPREGGDMSRQRLRRRGPSFNPRPREGGDADVRALAASPQEGFNPRPRGGATRYCTFIRSRQRVSIHAPARGATLTPDDGPAQFQSTPPRGGRRADSRGRAERFNPRPREGGDPGADGRPSQRDGFNPRPREGGDQAAGGSWQRCAGFNPRPRGGATVRAAA